MLFMSKILFLLTLLCTVSFAAPIGGFLNMQGMNGDVDTGTVPEDLWASGGAYPFPASATTTTIESGSSNDAAAGTGARTVEVVGLNSSLAEIRETATMNGTNAVTLTNSFYRINYIKVLTVGSGGVNAGILSVKHSSTVIGYVAAGDGQSNSAVYTVPVQAKLLGVRASVVTASQSGTFQLQVRENGGSWRTVYEVAVSAAVSPSYVPFSSPITIPAGSDIRLRATAISADNTAVKGGFDLSFMK